MEDNRSPLKNYFLALAVAFTAAAFALVLALCAAMNHWFFGFFAHGASMGVAGDVTAIWMPIAVAVFMPIAIAIYYAHRPPRPLNYPRIEHLRIAGKYVPTSAGKIGVSPLYLK